MTINMEVKKDGLHQLQSGSWKLTLTVNAEDMSMEIIQAAMGSPYGLAMVPIKYDDTPPNLDHFTTSESHPNYIRTLSEDQTKVRRRLGEEKSEGVKIKERACILCKEEKFQEYVFACGWAVPIDAYTEENHARYFVMEKCNIKSRKELVTNKEAQEKFKELDQKYKDWGYENRYEENLSRP